MFLPKPGKDKVLEDDSFLNQKNDKNKQCTYKSVKNNNIYNCVSQKYTLFYEILKEVQEVKIV